jgi:colicin import membrane protein
VRCAPYTFLPIAKYDAWKDVEVTFDPRDMYRG